MFIDLREQDRAADIFRIVREAEPDAEIRCRQERQFALLKIALVKLKRTDISISLLDRRGFLQRQVQARKVRVDDSRDSLTGAQLVAVQSLERAFRLCREQGLRIVGFSDSLVAVPRDLGYGVAVLSSPLALELDTQDAYHGFDEAVECESEEDLQGTCE